MDGLLLILLLLGLAIAWIEARHRLRPASPLVLRQSDWSINQRGASLVMEGWLEISNPHARMEVMVPELEVHPTLIGSADLRDIVTSTRITP